MKELVLATSNKNKLEEIKDIVISQGYKIKFILPNKDQFNPIEKGKTLEENSYIKAKAASDLMKMFSLADDTGLFVEALDGAPGIYSARYANSQEEKIARLLSELKGKDNRKAKFKCSMTLSNKEGEILYQSYGEIEGLITESGSGENGFGYDPIFYIPKLNKTMSELSKEEKNRVSHRGKALRLMLEWIENNLEKVV